MSIYSDSLPDDEYRFLAERENRRDRAEQEEQDMQALWEDEDSEGGLIEDD